MLYVHKYYFPIINRKILDFLMTIDCIVMMCKEINEGMISFYPVPISPKPLRKNAIVVPPFIVELKKRLSFKKPLMV